MCLFRAFVFSRFRRHFPSNGIKITAKKNFGDQQGGAEPFIKVPTRWG